MSGQVFEAGTDGCGATALRAEIQLPPRPESAVKETHGSHERRPSIGNGNTLGDYPLDGAFDEMREPCVLCVRTTRRWPKRWRGCRKKSCSGASSRRPVVSYPGHTFTVYGRDEARSASFRTICCATDYGAGVGHIERGLTQRITALNLFFGDVYSDAKILNDRVVPRELGLQLQALPAADAGLAGARNVYIGWWVLTCCG